MVSRCVNPQCRAEFRLLSEGNLFALERRSADTEFFWLCPSCIDLLCVSLDQTGHVSVQSLKDKPIHTPPNPDRYLRPVTHLANVASSRPPIAYHTSDDVSTRQPAPLASIESGEPISA
jgi:hypothetical protein